MNKRKLHHYWRQLHKVSLVVLAVVLIMSLAVSMWALRQNNLRMLALKEKVLVADRDNGDIEAALHELREYVYAHMNTDLASGPNAIRPPIQLKYRYERLLAAERQRVNAANAQIYTQAQAACERQVQGFSGGGRVPCIQDYVAKNGTPERPIPDALYKFDFISPRWTPDLAGWSLVASSALLLLIAARIVLGIMVRRELRRHQ